jgi:hypothetical protein
MFVFAFNVMQNIGKSIKIGLKIWGDCLYIYYLYFFYL